MSKYKGSKCLICDNTFTENDDVVVCPQCGTPYHRECYAKENKCINTKLHEENKSWTAEKDTVSDESPKKCPFCGNENNPHALICERCGRSFIERNSTQSSSQHASEEGSGQQNNAFFTFNPLDKNCGLNPDEEIAENVTVSDISDFVATSVPFYLLFFKKIKDTGRKISINIASILFPQIYFAYRKMLPMALLMVLIETLVSIPAVIIYMKSMTASLIDMGYTLEFIRSFDIQSSSFQIISSVCNYLSLIESVVLMLFANFLYYKHSVKKIRSIKAKTLSSEGAKEEIRHAGGTSFVLVFFTLAIQFAISVALIYIFFNL